MQRMEGIFMPSARRHRDDFLSGDARFVHYTSADSGLEIIKHKRIWMRNTTCMSDYREVRHGFDILNRFLSDKEKLKGFTEILDAISPGVVSQTINLFNQWWQDIQLNTYITSISEHDISEDRHGRLSMWRAFGGNTARVGIVFKVPKFSLGARGLNLMVSPVAYPRDEEAESEINLVMKNVSDDLQFLRSQDKSIVINYMFLMFVAAAICVKHEGFHEEREWRVIYSPLRTPSDLMESSLEMIGGVPQLVYKIPLDSSKAMILSDIDFAAIFDRLLIGPSPYPWVMYDAFVRALKDAGVKDADQRVFTSGIPIRS